MDRLLAATSADRPSSDHPRGERQRRSRAGPGPLLGPGPWTDGDRSVMLDRCSREVVGWLGAPRDRPTLAERLLHATGATQTITPGPLTRPADRGAALTSTPVAWLCAPWGVTMPPRRPPVADDTPAIAG